MKRRDKEVRKLFAVFPKMTWQIKLVYWTATAIFYLIYPFLWLEERIRG